MKQLSGGGDADTSKLIDPSRYPRPVSKFPKPTGNADPEIHDGGYVGKGVVVAPKAQFPLGFSGATTPPKEGNRQGAGGKGDIFKVGDGVIDRGEGWINVTKADGGKEKRPLKTGPKGGKYYEGEGGTKHYIGGEGGAPSKPTGEEPTGGPESTTNFEGKFDQEVGEVVAKYKTTLNPSEGAAIDSFFSDMDAGEPPYSAAFDLWENLREQPGWDAGTIKTMTMDLLGVYNSNKSDGELPEDDEDDVKKAEEIVDEMIEDGDVAPEDKEKVLPAAIAALARVGSKVVGAATKTPGRALVTGAAVGRGAGGGDEGTTTFPGTSKEEDEEKVDPRELAERAVDVGGEVGASVTHGGEVRVHETATDPMDTVQATGQRATEMINQKKAENVMKEMQDGIQKNGRVTYLKMCEDRAKTLKGIIDKSDLSTFNVMKDMGVTEDALSDELQKAEYMIEVLHER